MQDRIKQMAVEAGFPSMAVDNLSDTDRARLVAFARLVAEDCARLVDGNAAQCSGITADILHSNADAIRARYT